MRRRVLIILGLLVFFLVFYSIGKSVAHRMLEGQVCTLEALICPDGSAVGRGGPNCEFATCPDVEPDTYPEDPNGQVACTMDAKQCPDGSYVGRVGPDCEFAPCPNAYWPIRYGEDVSKMEDYRRHCEQRMGVFNECGSACPLGAEVCPAVCSMLCELPTGAKGTMCTPASREVDACIEIYAPVCGAVQVECVTEPCEPALETFSNSCHACRNDRVLSYTEGKCGGSYSR